MFRAGGLLMALLVLSGALVAACGSGSPPASPGSSLPPAGTSGPTTGTDPGATPVLPPPQVGEVTMYGTFFAGDSLDVLHEYDIALESSSYVIVAIRSETGTIGLLDRFTKPSYANIWYGSYTTAGRLFSTTFGGDALDDLTDIRERNPITYEAEETGLTICCTNFGATPSRSSTM